MSLSSQISLLATGLGNYFRDAILPRLTPVGQVAAFAMDTPPAGWLECNAALVSRTTYAALFSKIGTTFGAGDGSTTFRLPGLRGEFIRGWSNGSAVDSGRAFGSSQDDAFESHMHDVNYALQSNTTTGGAGARVTGLSSGGATTASNAARPTGDTETRPRNVALMYCIKY